MTPHVTSEARLFAAAHEPAGLEPEPAQENPNLQHMSLKNAAGNAPPERKRNPRQGDAGFGPKPRRAPKESLELIDSSLG